MYNCICQCRTRLFYVAIPCSLSHASLVYIDSSFWSHGTLKIFQYLCFDSAYASLLTDCRLPTYIIELLMYVDMQPSWVVDAPVMHTSLQVNIINHFVKLGLSHGNYLGRSRVFIHRLFWLKSPLLHGFKIEHYTSFVEVAKLLWKINYVHEEQSLIFNTVLGWLGSISNERGDPLLESLFWVWANKEVKWFICWFK